MAEGQVLKPRCRCERGSGVTSGQSRVMGGQQQAGCGAAGVQDSAMESMIWR